MIISNNWYGRLGNNILQIGHIIDLAIMYRHNIKFNSKHELFDLSIIENYFNKYNNSKIITDRHNFHYLNILSYSPKWNLKLNNISDVFGQNDEIKIKLLKDSFLVKNVKKLPENDLVIHIRSGDIFSSNPHPNYVPPPLEYYTKQIAKKNYDKIIIVCEDQINPVVNKLLELYKHAVYKKNSLTEDIEIILGASNIIYSVGTFVSALKLLSDNINYIYGNDFNNKEFDDYYKIMKPWKNTEKQREYILTYKYNENEP